MLRLTVHNRIALALIVVLATGIGLSVTISHNGKQVSNVSDQLIEHQLPQLANIRRLKQLVLNFERVLYEYYATQDSARLWPEAQDIQGQIEGCIGRLDPNFDISLRNRLQENFEVSKVIAQNLNDNLASNQTSWDLARQQLESLSNLGRQSSNALSSFTKEIENQVGTIAKTSQRQVNHTTNLVISFSLLISIIAGLVAYFVNAYLSETASRRALALFPERNPNPVLNFDWNGNLKYLNNAAQNLLAQLEDGKVATVSLLTQRFITEFETAKKQQSEDVSWIEVINQRHLDYQLFLFRDLEACHLYIEDITEQVIAEETLRFQAFHDSLTELPNRRNLDLRIKKYTSESQPIHLLLTSLDRFELITSSQGYDTGDRLIQECANRLKQSLNTTYPNAELFRLDGTVFCVLIPHNFYSSPQTLFEFIQSTIQAPLQVDERLYYTTLSMGLSSYPEHGTSSLELIRNADAALIRAKKGGGDQGHVYIAKLHSNEQNWIPIETGMRQALKSNEFTLHYQAKVDSQSLSIAGSEALIRWRQKDGSMVSPGLFIPIAEQTGFITHIGNWVLETACNQLINWCDNGLKLKVSINISARSFQHRHFVSTVERIIEETGVPVELLELEITESLIMENVEHSVSTMRALKEKGLGLSIDDFGTGYSSLSYLKKFPIDTLKIDREFVKNLEHNKDDRQIVQSIIGLAKNLGLETVAEGVETTIQWEFLKSLNCDKIQGFLFSKPTDASDLLVSTKRNINAIDTPLVARPQ